MKGLAGRESRPCIRLDDVLSQSESNFDNRKGGHHETI